jgi:hypothetical protein
MRLAQDRRVLEKQVGMSARAADPCTHGEFAARTKREGSSADGAGLEFVRPDEVAGTAVATDRRHGAHLSRAKRQGIGKKALRRRAAKPARCWEAPPGLSRAGST